MQRQPHFGGQTIKHIAYASKLADVVEDTSPGWHDTDGRGCEVEDYGVGRVVTKQSLLGGHAVKEDVVGVHQYRFGCGGHSWLRWGAVRKRSRSDMIGTPQRVGVIFIDAWPRELRNEETFWCKFWKVRAWRFKALQADIVRSRNK